MITVFESVTYALAGHAAVVIVCIACTWGKRSARFRLQYMHFESICHTDDDLFVMHIP
jgi:hypothetical protein